MQSLEEKFLILFDFWKIFRFKVAAGRIFSEFYVNCADSLSGIVSVIL